MGRPGIPAAVGAVLGVWLAAAPRAQDAATTLSRLADRADHVAVVRVLASRPTPDGAWRDVTLRTVETLRGAPPAVFTLREPDGLGCGRAFAGLAVGAGHLAFVDATATGPALTTSGSRALPRLAPGLVEHVRGLVAAATPAARTPLWIAALAHDDERIRRDAAADLARAPAIVPPGLHAALAAAVARAADRSDAPELLDLARAAARGGCDGALDGLVAALLRPAAAASTDALRGAVAASVAAFPADRVALRLGAALRASPTADPVLALAVLDTADQDLAVAIAPAVLAALPVGGRESAGIALLRAGVPEAVLAPHATTTDLARWQQRAASAPRFRSIDPRGRR